MTKFVNLESTMLMRSELELLVKAGRRFFVTLTCFCFDQKSVQQRDSGRAFVLGERVQYVLLGGHRTQDEAAEDPLTAGLQNLTPDYELYWKNKLLKR